MDTPETYTAFKDQVRISHGELTEVALEVKRKIDKAPNATYLVFSDVTGKAVDLNLQGSEKEVRKRLEIFVPGPEVAAAGGPGRPKLGVVSREISLLPRQWEWLALQPGGASSTLRKLVDEARKKTQGAPDPKTAQERTYRFMMALAGDFPGYQEALRALYRKDKKIFKAKIAEWPEDIRRHTLEMSKQVFE